MKPAMQDKPLCLRVTVLNSLLCVRGGIKRGPPSGRQTASLPPSLANSALQVPQFAFSPLQRNLFPPTPSLPSCSSSERPSAMHPVNPVDAAVRDLQDQALLPRNSSLDLTLELIVGDSAVDSVLRASGSSPGSSIKDVSALIGYYDSPAQPLCVALLRERDAAFFLNPTNGEVIIEATAGESRTVVIVGDDFRQHEILGPQEGAKAVFTGLAAKKTYIIGLVTLRSLNALADEAQPTSEFRPTLQSLLRKALDSSLRREGRSEPYTLQELELRVRREYKQLSLDFDPPGSARWANIFNTLWALGRKREARQA